jgi:hypothetical protein
MKRLLLLMTVNLLISLTSALLSFCQDRPDAKDMQEHLAGAWRLAWLEEPDAEGKVHRAECTGLLVYTLDGHMSVQVMYRTPQGGRRAAPAQYAQGGYEASFGTYQIEDAHTFSFHVEGALVRSLIGKNLKRVYELSGNRLIVKPSDPNEHWRVAWEHD